MAQLSQQQRKEYADLFKRFDKDKSGFISEDELHSLIVEIQGKVSSDVHLKNLMNAYDRDGDGKINFAEFCEIMASNFNLDAEMDAAFRAIDTDGSGFIDVDELQGLFERLGRPLADGQLQALFKFADVNKDNKLSREEFAQMYTSLTMTNTSSMTMKTPWGSKGSCQGSCCLIL